MPSVEAQYSRVLTMKRFIGASQPQKTIRIGTEADYTCLNTDIELSLLPYEEKNDNKQPVFDSSAIHRRYA